jgi:hypothetical protein
VKLVLTKVVETIVEVDPAVVRKHHPDERSLFDHAAEEAAHQGRSWVVVGRHVHEAAD